MYLATGNYAWINLTGILPCITCFDDQFLSKIFLFKSINEEKQKERKKYKIEKKENLFFNYKIGKIYRFIRVIIYILLLFFIVSKSTAPVQEMLSTSPWLKYYDDYFFVTAQGLFGFINEYRVVLYLEYTNDNYYEDGGGGGNNTLNTNCVDQSHTGLSDSSGNPLDCNQLVDFCYHPSYGNQIRTVCKKSCALCSIEIPKNITWYPLDFKNLPGSLDRAPFFNSPVHYRFDWEVWIHVTARMESRRNSPLQIPLFIKSLISKILAGDTDAASLMGTKLDKSPNAIKAQFYLYEFSDKDQLFNEGKWWKRTELPNSQIQLFTKNADKWNGDVTISNPQRNWFLFFIVLGFVFSLNNFYDSPKSIYIFNFILLLIFALLFIFIQSVEYNRVPTFLGDYILVIDDFLFGSIPFILYITENFDFKILLILAAIGSFKIYSLM